MKYSIIVVGLLMAVVVAYVLWPKEAHTISTSFAPIPVMRTITVGTTAFKVETVDTESSRELGLSGRASLSQGQGMLFVFDHPANWGFWMKDMHFAIDIIFIDTNDVATTIYRSISPDTYPQVFYPKNPDTKYVLEVAAGAAASIAEGDKLVVQ